MIDNRKNKQIHTYGLRGIGITYLLEYLLNLLALLAATNLSNEIKIKIHLIEVLQFRLAVSYFNILLNGLKTIMTIIILFH